eukprot:TRINITY_DN45865_c0_g1_i1.p1 TRINITY_DN45865_c0_g1~~TRINITY_DN45865_c0_g1_i1.p1  ORF type:complete len:198 (-),score=15.08 TRINITY_DN45865_c0_g1_i1:127-720(-)
MSLITGLNSYRKEPASGVAMKDRFAQPVNFMKGMEDGGDWVTHPKSRDKIANDSGAVWQCAFRMMTPPDASGGPWLVSHEEPMNPLVPMGSRCRRYVPEPEVEKDVTFRACRVKKLDMPGQAYPSSIRPLSAAAPPTGNGGVARPSRRRTDGRPPSCSAPLTARDTLCQMIGRGASRRASRKPVGTAVTRHCVCPGS